MSRHLVAGIGLRRGCAADEIVELVRQACAAAERSVTALAAPSFKREEAALAEAAATLDVALVFVDEAALREAQAGCVTRSAVAERAVGFGSVAEAAALAASGGRLILPRIKGSHATCALAEGA